MITIVLICIAVVIFLGICAVAIAAAGTVLGGLGIVLVPILLMIFVLLAFKTFVNVIL